MSDSQERERCWVCDRPRSTGEELDAAAADVETWDGRDAALCFRTAHPDAMTGHDDWRMLAVVSSAFTKCQLEAIRKRESLCLCCDFVGQPADLLVHIEQCAGHPAADWRAKCLESLAERDAARAESIHAKRSADWMAAGITVAIAAHLLDARSPAGDALLDYLDSEPMTVERAWDILSGRVKAGG